MNKTLYLGLGLMLMVALLPFVQSTSLVVEREGMSITINEAYCQDETKGMQELGSDFYLLCEGNFEEEYNNQTLLELLNQTTEAVEEQALDLHDERTQQALKTLAIILLGMVAAMVLLRYRTLRKHQRESLMRLQPYLTQLRDRGYSDKEIHQMLLKRGYDQNFINDLLGRQ